FGSDRADLFICGDDTPAKKVVGELATDIGFDVVDVGSLANARMLENLALLWIELALRQQLGPNIAFKLLRRKAEYLSVSPFNIKIVYTSQIFLEQLRY